MRVKLLLFYLFIFGCVSAQNHSVSDKEINLIYHRAEKALDKLWENTEGVDSGAVNDLYNTARTAYSKYNENRDDNFWYLIDYYFFRAVADFSKSRVILNKIEQKALLDSARQYYNDYLDNGPGSFGYEWFSGDQIYVALEDFTDNNLWKLFHLRLERLSVSQIEDNYLSQVHALGDLANTESDLGMFKESFHDINEALQQINSPLKGYNKRWYKSYKKTLYSEIYSDAVNVFMELDSIDRAWSCVLAAEKIIGKPVEEIYYLYPELLYSKAYCLLRKGQHVRTLNLLDRFIQDTIFMNPGVLALIAMAYEENGSDLLAEEYYQKSLSGFVESDNIGLQKSQACLNFARFFAKLGNVDSCFKFLKISRHYLGDFVNNSFPLMSAKEKQVALKRHESFLHSLGVVSEFDTIRNSSEFAAIVLEFSSLYKGLTLDFQQKMYSATYVDSSLGKLFRILNSTRNQLAYNYEANRRKRIDDSQAEEDEHILNQTFFDLGIPHQDYTMENIRNGLDSQSALIDLVPLGSFENGNKYAAIYLTKFSDPKLEIILFDAEENKNNFKSNLATRGLNIYVKPQKSNSNALKLNFIASDTHNWQRLYFSPSGSFFELPVSSVLNKTMPESVVIYLFSPLSLVYNISPKISADTLNISCYGNADFNELRVKFYNKPMFTEMCHGVWQSLPGTKKEIEKIQQIFKWHSNIFSDSQFTEANFRGYYWFDYTHSYMRYVPHVVHIASHGFYLDHRQGNFFESSYDPLVRCGFLASGANCAWTADTGKLSQLAQSVYGYDGVITGLEINDLDMHGTRLVVLSACETGRGEAAGVDGPVGLPKAFKMAGADYVMVTLWPVPDDETALFMSLYYTELKKTKDIEIAFKNARNICAQNGLSYTSWGAFVLYK